MSEAKRQALIDDALAAREELRAEILTADRPNPEWLRDRIESLAWWNRRLKALGHFPAAVAAAI